MKLDKITKMRIRQELRDRQDADLKKRADDGKALLVAAADSRIKAEWADKQDDMAVLAKYGRAKPIKGANLRVWNPDDQKYTIIFGVEHDYGLLMPSVGGYDSAYWSGYIRQDAPEYEAALDLHRLRETYLRRQIEERDALDSVLRGTTSVKRVAESYHWVHAILEGG